MGGYPFTLYIVPLAGICWTRPPCGHNKVEVELRIKVISDSFYLGDRKANELSIASEFSAILFYQRPTNYAPNRSAAYGFDPEFERKGEPQKFEIAGTYNLQSSLAILP
jgi:hypothetical protein